MAYKWKPSKGARRQFAENMKNPGFAAGYYNRKEDKADKRQAGSQFDYQSAGGEYIPTENQYKESLRHIAGGGLTPEQYNACNIVSGAYICNYTCHHDYIHIVNELTRSKL